MRVVSWTIAALTLLFLHSLTYAQSYRAAEVEAIMLRLANGAGEDAQCTGRWRRPGFRTDPETQQVREVFDPQLAQHVRVGDTIQGPSGQRHLHTSPALQIDLARGRLSVMREGQARVIAYQPPLLCYRPVHLSPSSKLRARTRRDGIEITAGLLDFTRTEAELAFPLAHELSHFALGHSRQITAAKASGTLTKRQRRNMEYQADLGAIWLMQRAGYDPTAAVDFLARRSRLDDIPRLGLSGHPRRKQRIKAIEAALPALNAPDTDPSNLASFVTQFRPNP